MFAEHDAIVDSQILTLRPGTVASGVDTRENRKVGRLAVTVGKAELPWHPTTIFRVLRREQNELSALLDAVLQDRSCFPAGRGWQRLVLLVDVNRRSVTFENGNHSGEEIGILRRMAEKGRSGGRTRFRLAENGR